MATALALVAVIAVVTGEDPRQAPSWIRIAGIAFLAALIALASALLLCRLRSWLLRPPAPVGIAAALLTAGLAGFALTLLAATVARELVPELALAEGAPLPLALRAALLALLGAAVALRYFYVLERWRAGVEAQARAEMDALQARIHPHFLFNTLNSIASLIAIDPERAERAVEDFADLMRATLGRRGSHSLGEELALIERYLAIEKLRLGERLAVELELGEAPLALEVPVLLLQPLVENAVLHGIQRLPAGGTVAIRARREPGALVLEVRNPIPEGEPEGDGGMRFALDNIRRRLALRHGRAAALATRREAGYYACELRLPLP
ncbi:MAG: sensor histidine kinase [Xanthomonadales bacterium]|nr:sensor histidine kinase [Xanthomonadales bacterium]